MISIILSIASIIAVVYLHIKINNDIMDVSFENFEFEENLNERISTLESGMAAHIQNMRELSSRMDALTQDIQQLNESLQQVATFTDRTRSIVDANTHRLNVLESEAGNNQ